MMTDTREKLMRTTDPLEATLIIDRDWDRLGSNAGVRTILCAMGGFRDSITVQRASVQGLTQLSARNAMLKAIATSGGTSAVISAMNRYRKDEALQALGLEFLSTVALHYILDPAQVAREVWYETVTRSMAAHPRSEDVRLYGAKALCALLSTEAAPTPAVLPHTKQVLLACLTRASPNNHHPRQSRQLQPAFRSRRKQQQQQSQLTQSTQSTQSQAVIDIQRHSLFALAILSRRSPLTQASDFQAVIGAMERCTDDLELQSSAITILSNSLRDVSSPTAIGNAIAATKAVETIAAAFRRFRGPQYRSARLAACSALISLLHIAPALRARAVTAKVVDTALGVAVAGAATASGEGDIGATACALLALLFGDPALSDKQLVHAAETLLGVLRANTESEALQNIGCYALRCALRKECVKDRVVALRGPALLAEILLACPHPYPADALAHLVIGGASSQHRKEEIAGVKSPNVFDAVAVAVQRCPDVLPAAALFLREMFSCDDAFYERIKGKGKLPYRGSNANVLKVVALMNRTEDPRAVKAREDRVCSKSVAKEGGGSGEEMCQRFKKCVTCGGVLICQSCWEAGPHKDHECVDFFAIGKCSN